MTAIGRRFERRVFSACTADSAGLA